MLRDDSSAPVALPLLYNAMLQSLIVFLKMLCSAYNMVPGQSLKVWLSFTKDSSDTAKYDHSVKTISCNGGSSNMRRHFLLHSIIMQSLYFPHLYFIFIPCNQLKNVVLLSWSGNMPSILVFNKK